jgi:uncharacterized protein (TIGR02246 family)
VACKTQVNYLKERISMSNNANENAVRRLVEAWASAIRAGDLEGVLAHHTEDVVLFDAPLPLQRTGMAEYKKAWELFFEHSPGGEGSFDLRELNIIAGDTTAFCHSLVDVSGLNVRLTMGFRKVDGEWLIAHEHHSAPSE